MTAVDRWQTWLVTPDSYFQSGSRSAENSHLPEVAGVPWFDEVNSTYDQVSISDCQVGDLIIGRHWQIGQGDTNFFPDRFLLLSGSGVDPHLVRRLRLTVLTSSGPREITIVQYVAESTKCWRMPK